MLLCLEELLEAPSGRTVCLPKIMHAAWGTKMRCSLCAGLAELHLGGLARPRNPPPQRSGSLKAHRLTGDFLQSKLSLTEGTKAHGNGGLRMSSQTN